MAANLNAPVLHILQLLPGKVFVPADAVSHHKDRSLHAPLLKNRQKLRIVALIAVIKGQDDRLIRQLLQALLRPEKIPDGNSGITLLLQIIQLLLEILHRHIVLVSILGLLRLHHVVLKDRKALRLRLRQQVLQSAIASQQHRCQGSQPPFQIFFHAITSFA